MINKIIINILLMIVFFNFVYTEDSELILARELNRNGNFENAAHEYKRYLFFHPDSYTNTSLIIEIAGTYRKSGKKDLCLSLLEAARTAVEDEKIKNIYTLEIQYTRINDYNKSEVRMELLELENFQDDPDIKKQAAFLLFLSYIINSEWTSADQAFNRYLDYWNQVNPQTFQRTGLKMASFIRLKLKEAEKADYKSPELAGWLSTFIIGSGQIYAGNFLSGLNALALNSAIIVYIYSSILSGNYADAILVGMFVMDRYYSGNIQNARKIAEDHNEKINTKFLNDILIEMNY